MAFLSHKKKEIRAKIVYYGPGLSGKTSNVEYIFKKMRSDHRGDLINLSTKDRTLFFDFLPVELGSIKGYATSFHIFTVPGQVFYNETRKAVLQDVDGLVFVADSQKKMRDENERSLKNLEKNLAEYGKKLSDIPHVFQYNKRDVEDIMSVEELHLLLNKTGAPFFEAVATEGRGVLNTLKLISKMVLKKLASTASSIEEDEEAFQAQNYGLSDDYVALKPGEHAPASVKAVTSLEIGMTLPESEAEGAVETGEPIEEGEEVEEAVEVATPAGEVSEAYEADIGAEPVDESEIPEPPAGTEWQPPADEGEEIAEEATPVASNADEGLDMLASMGDQSGEVAEVESAEEGDEISVAEPADESGEVVEEVVEEAELISGEVAGETVEIATPVESAGEAVEIGEAEEVAEAVAAEPAPVANPAPKHPPEPMPTVPNMAPGMAPKEIKLYQWGFPERIDVNTIRIPIFFRDEDTGDEFWSYLTIGLEHIYKRH